MKRARIMALGLAAISALANFLPTPPSAHAQEPTPLLQGGVQVDLETQRRLDAEDNKHDVADVNFNDDERRAELSHQEQIKATEARPNLAAGEKANLIAKANEDFQAFLKRLARSRAEEDQRHEKARADILGKAKGAEAPRSFTGADPRTADPRLRYASAFTQQWDERTKEDLGSNLLMMPLNFLGGKIQTVGKLLELVGKAGALDSLLQHASQPALPGETPEAAATREANALYDLYALKGAFQKGPGVGADHPANPSAPPASPEVPAPAIPRPAVGSRGNLPAPVPPSGTEITPPGPVAKSPEPATPVQSSPATHPPGPAQESAAATPPAPRRTTPTSFKNIKADSVVQHTYPSPPAHWSPEAIGEAGMAAEAAQRGYWPLLPPEKASTTPQGFDGVYFDTKTGAIVIAEAKGGYNGADLDGVLGQGYGARQGTIEWATKAAQRVTRALRTNDAEVRYAEQIQRALTSGQTPVRIEVFHTETVNGQPGLTHHYVSDSTP